MPKFKYNGKEYRQRNAVLNIIKDLSPKMTFEQLLQNFPQGILKGKSYKLFTPIDEVKSYSEDWKKRYFTDDIIETKDKVKFYLWNQFGRTVG